jgi:hypothetical protein
MTFDLREGRLYYTPMDQRRTWMFKFLTLPLITILFAGCVERTLSINTEPEGATVMLNDQDVGKSPVRVPFTWYGDYDIVVRKQGYETIKTHHRVNPPWYQLPFIELVSELFIPATVHDDQHVPIIVMEPESVPTREQLLTSGDELRDRAQSGGGQ